MAGGKPSRFDPVTQAFAALQAAGRGDTGPPPAASPAASPVAPIQTARTVPPSGSGTPRPTPSSIAKRGRNRVQLNVNVRPEVAARLRAAVLDLGREYSLGDLITYCADDALTEVVDRLARQVRADDLRNGGRS